MIKLYKNQPPLGGFSCINDGCYGIMWRQSEDIMSKEKKPRKGTDDELGEVSYTYWKRDSDIKIW